MKFKKTILIMFLLFAVLTIGAVSAADNNMTDEVISVENTQNSSQINPDQSEGEDNVSMNSDNNGEVLGKSNEDEVALTTSSISPVLGVAISETTVLKASISEPAKLTVTKKTTSHYVKVGKYKGKLTNSQYKKLKMFYKKNSKYKFVTIKCTNKKYHKITIQLLTGYNGQNGKYYKKGFYASVWDTRYGMDGMKIYNKRVRV